MCQPTLPAGCGPSNCSARNRGRAGSASGSDGAWQTITSPSVRVSSACRPLTNSASRPASASAGGGACGRVSVAVMKIARGVAPGAATRENGRVRSAVHRPDSSSNACTRSRSGGRASARSADHSKATWLRCGSASSGPSSTTTEMNARRAPRCTARTVPAAGDVKRTPGFFLSSNSGCPRRTAAPGSTSRVGRRPGVSLASSATCVTTAVGGAPASSAGAPAMGTSSPLLFRCSAMVSRPGGGWPGRIVSSSAARVRGRTSGT